MGVELGLHLGFRAVDENWKLFATFGDTTGSSVGLARSSNRSRRVDRLLNQYSLNSATRSAHRCSFAESFRLAASSAGTDVASSAASAARASAFSQKSTAALCENRNRLLYAGCVDESLRCRSSARPFVTC